MTYIYLVTASIFFYIIYIRFFGWSWFFNRCQRVGSRSFFMSCFLLSPLFTILLYHDITIITMISWFFYFLILYIYLFLFRLLLSSMFLFFGIWSRHFCIWSSLFLWKLLWSALFSVLFTNREYNSGNFYTNPYFCLQIVNNLQNTKYTKYKIFRRLQNTKYKIYFISWQFFLFGTLNLCFK